VARAKTTHKPKLDILVNPKTKGLTEKQEKFCRIYATEDVTRTEAARLAGYSEKTAPVAGSKFLNGRDFPHILARVAELKEELAKKYEVTFDGHVRQLARIRDAAFEKGNFPAAVSAEKARGAAAGLYVTRQEILVGKIDQMSREEVLAEIAKLQQEFPVLANATAPTIDMIRGPRGEDDLFVADPDQEDILAELEQ
jgi:hypothetical protein